jgi:hypothetical protein
MIVLMCCVIGQVQSGHANGPEDWVKQNLVNHERVLCQRNVSGEYFFLAKAGDEVKVGSRLDMTGYPAAHVFTIAWTFQNEQHGSVGAKVPPKTVKQSYTKSDSKVFAENVEYQTLAIGQAKTVRVVVHIGKCVGPDCDKQVAAIKRDKEYKVELCVVQASEFGPR